MAGLCEGGNEPSGSLKPFVSDNAGKMSPGSSTDGYPAFAHIGLRENPGKNLNQVTCPDRESNPGHLVSRTDALTVIPHHAMSNNRNSQPEDVNKEKINIYLPRVDYFKAKYQLEDIEVIGLLIGARGVIPKFFESFRKTFELPQTLTADIITSVLKRSCQILSHHIHSV
ncbi:hypothetical protein ANN_11896 [Periplaneta americana]|uniref:Uncharacterized protein n=1 Tax=Periplaneta americana TaxID=6978 RepID=A0ABQ8T6B7_PERAM|nr:hypothetical protein ANN_11896 [Periplaneta americana]